MFHVNSETGKTGVCSAKKGHCPYGGETGLDNHFQTRKAARTAAEKMLEDKHGATSSISSKINPSKIKKVVGNTQRVGSNIKDASTNLKSESTFIKNNKSLSTELENFRKLHKENAYENSQDIRIFEEGYEEHFSNSAKLNKEIQKSARNISDLREKIQEQILADEDFLHITKNDKSMATYKERKKASQRIKEFATTSPSEWKTGQKQANKFTKREVRPEYIDSIDKKHITSQSAGSKFTDPRIKKAEDVMVLALAQRGNLQGDDREKLIASGASPDAFLPKESGVRYLQVQTSGTEAIKDTATMNDNDVLTVVAKGRNDGKPSSLSFATEVTEQPTTEYATVIIGPDMDENKQPIPNTEVLWTMHPGTPTRGIRSDTIRENGLDDGSKITVKELRKRFGKDIKVNTKLV